MSTTTRYAVHQYIDGALLGHATLTDAECGRVMDHPEQDYNLGTVPLHAIPNVELLPEYLGMPRGNAVYLELVSAE